MAREQNMIYDDWSKVTVAQYDAMVEIQAKHSEDAAKYIVEMLYGIDDAERLPMHVYSAYLAGLRSFHRQDVRAAQLTKDATYRIGNTTYRVNLSPNAFTAGQYIDFVNNVRDKAPMARILTALIVPDGHEYNDGYDVGKAAEDMGKLPVKAAFAVFNFFGEWSRRSIRTSLRFLTRQMRRGVDEERKAKVEELKNRLEELYRLMASYPTC